MKMVSALLVHLQLKVLLKNVPMEWYGKIVLITQMGVFKNAVALTECK